MRYRFLNGRLSAGAPKMTIKAHVAWPLRIVVALVVLAAAAGFGAWWASGGLPGSQRDKDRAQVETLRAENLALHAERDRLLATTNTTDSKRVMERSTVKELGDQVAKLEAENVKLKEDVAFFEAATTEQRPQAAAAGGIAIRRFQVTQDETAHTARYRLLVTQDSKANRDFAGELQLVVTVVQAGKTANITLPDFQVAGARNAGSASVSIDGDATQFDLVFRSYKRIEGSLRMPAEASLKAVHAKILERGVVRAQQTVTLG